VTGAEPWDAHMLWAVVLREVFLPLIGLDSFDRLQEAEGLRMALKALFVVRAYLAHPSPLPYRNEIQHAFDGLCRILLAARRLSAEVGGAGAAEVGETLEVLEPGREAGAVCGRTWPRRRCAGCT